MIRKKIMIVILSVFLLSLSACSKDEEDIVGVYYPVSCTDEEGNEYELEDEELHILPDGKGYFIFQDNRYELLWTYKDGVFSFEDSSLDEFIGSFVNGVISGKYFFDYHYVFKKKK